MKNFLHQNFLHQITHNFLKQHDDRIGLTLEAIKDGFLDYLFFNRGTYPDQATDQDIYQALAMTIRDRLVQRWLHTYKKATMEKDTRVVIYLSAEYLMGPQLGHNIVNLGVREVVEKAMNDLGIDLQSVLDAEVEPGLANGGLGNVAASYLDGLSSLEVPAIGYGIRYEFGLFRQSFSNGWQIEETDKWLQFGFPWEIQQFDRAVEIKFGGSTQRVKDESGNEKVNWIPSEEIKGIPYDVFVPGYKVNTVNTLRLWKAEAIDSFNFQSFNVGDYYGAVDKKVSSENITKVLYPNDESIEGKILRLKQQYFFVSCALQDCVNFFLESGGNILDFHEKFVVQLNDTHPTIAIPELMRILVDEQGVAWDEAWHITQKTFGYTQHTLLPEALEKWPVGLLGQILPRHMEIIYDINYKFLNLAREHFPNHQEIIRTLSLIDETGEKYVRMANLACAGSFSINGVANLQTELLKSYTLKDFYSIFPEKFNNKTNGIAPRRWLMLINNRLTQLLDDTIGTGWEKDLDQLKSLEPFAENQDFVNKWKAVKKEIKNDLAQRIFEQQRVKVDPNSMFDILVKRIHEYKRQHLKVLHIISLYRKIKDNPNESYVPRTFIFGGKAAPGYRMAKLIIKLINSVAEVINNDSSINDLIKVVFIPNYNVRNSQWIYPAADLSEQISTAGKEASGTGNMKFSVNGALTVGTYDGANIEIREEVGSDNFFLFGLKADEVKSLKESGYNPYTYYQENESLRKAIDMINHGYFSPNERDLFRPLTDHLLYYDEYMVMADFTDYVRAQEEAEQLWSQSDAWAKASILNTARMGKFSSDRTVREYLRDIWKADAVEINIKDTLH
ncbi:glycogen/starch/alpha-glucan phosphorylase [Aureibacter tunicatorum]|uniref:Alpha-1,4 glucan phosphorylase n=1 Tax=Aureibacter tunicatorum TaxID=866807 RepID=A0AAE3XR90_9BACT|nr:glycogen/starch/alpha-glucan phosphorylase [Aureibacter tunicatorum]MDR6240554.1 starch phosphorylase [Aureibacter tunicatorum]BDD06585.1 alpha-1,4 glucan phosphorylase [Aureibacter tunicatorum]